MYLSLINGGRFTAGGGLPLCVLVGLWPDVDDPPSELNGGVKFCGFLLIYCDYCDSKQLKSIPYLLKKIPFQNKMQSNDMKLKLKQHKTTKIKTIPKPKPTANQTPNPFMHACMHT